MTHHCLFLWVIWFDSLPLWGWWCLCSFLPKVESWCLSTRAGDRFYPGRSTDPLNTWMLTCRNQHLCTCVTRGIAFSRLLVMGCRYEAELSWFVILCSPCSLWRQRGILGKSLQNTLQRMWPEASRAVASFYGIFYSTSCCILKVINYYLILTPLKRTAGYPPLFLLSMWPWRTQWRVWALLFIAFPCSGTLCAEDHYPHALWSSA